MFISYLNLSIFIYTYLYKIYNFFIITFYNYFYRKSPLHNNQHQSTTISNNSPNNVTRQNSWFPLHFSIAINDQEELSIQTENNITKTDEVSLTTAEAMDTLTNSSNEIFSSPSDKIENDNKNILKSQQSYEPLKKLSTNSSNDLYQEYFLHSVVCQIDDGHQKNLVSLINVDKRYFRIKMANTSNKCQKEEVDMLKNQWYIFNDFW